MAEADKDDVITETYTINKSDFDEAVGVLAASFGDVRRERGSALDCMLGPNEWLHLCAELKATGAHCATIVTALHALPPGQRMAATALLETAAPTIPIARLLSKVAEKE